MWKVKLLLLALCSAVRASAGRTAFATTGRDIALGYADESVDTVVVFNDVAWTDEDWAGIPVPVLLKRNFTVTGRAPGPDGLLVSWDSNYVSKKVRLVNSTMTLRYFVVFRSRSGNQNLAPGCDMLEPCARGEWGRVLLDKSFLVQRLCYPASMHASALAGVVRPPAYPGTQAYRALLLQPTCDAKFVNAFGNGSSSNTAVEALKAAAPPPPPPAPQLRCWSHMGAYDNLGIFCADLDASQKQVLTGYTLLMTNVTYVCDDIITDECVARLGTVGCYNNWADYKAQQLALAPSPPLAASDGGGISINATLSGSAGGDDGGSSGGGSGGLSDTEQVLVGAIIGGVGGALLIGAVLGFFVWRRRKAAREVPQLPVADKGNATAGAAGASGFTNLDVKSDGGSAWALCPPFTRVRRADSRYAVPPACAIGKQRQDWLYSSGAPAMGSSSASEGLPGATADVMSSPSATEQQLSRLPDRLGGASSRSELDGACASVQDAQHDSDEGLEMAGIYETVEVVTLDTPQRVEVKTDVLLDPTVTLLPKQLGRGTFGRVLEGRYQGQKVAVKLLNESAFGVAAGVTKSTGALPGMRAGAAAAAGAAAGGMDKGGNGGEECGGQTRQIMLDALVQEVEVLGRCRHPNVVRLLAACLTPPRLCLVMELMETSLERMLYGGGPEQPLLPLGTVLDIALDVAQGLSYLHPTIVHRDLKPGNVLVNLNGGKRPLAKLSDFGLLTWPPSYLT